MKLKNRMIALILSLVMTLLMSSCTMVGKSPDQLIRPPRPTGEYAGIQRALEEVAEDFTLKYPETGEYRSAVKTMILDVINEEKGAYWVTVDGKTIPQCLARKKWEASETGWLYEATTSSVLVKYPALDRPHEVVVSFDKFDLIGMEEQE